MLHEDIDHAIAFLTGAVRVTSRTACLLMDTEWDKADDTTRWDVKLDERLRAHFATKARPGNLRTLQQLAELLYVRSRETGRIPRSAHVLLKELYSQGILQYHKLAWVDSSYLPWPRSESHDGTSSVLAFRPSDDVREEGTHWREYYFDVETSADAVTAHIDEYAAIYGILGLQAQRRLLMSPSAQRSIHKIALPWARVRFRRRDDLTSCSYMIVPVVTLWSRGKTSRIRRTLTLTMYLLPKRSDKESPLSAEDLASLCHQSSWLPARPRVPALEGTSPSSPMLHFEGPLYGFVKMFISENENLLPDVFDATMRKVLDVLGVATAGRGDQVRARVAISRTRSAIFGASIRISCPQGSSVWNHLTRTQSSGSTDIVRKMLSVNAGRNRREFLVDGEAIGLAEMRLTNAYEKDTNQIAFYNPISRFMLNVNPKDDDLFTSVANNFGAAWLDLLATTVCSTKEILRSLRHETQRYRDDIFGREETKSGDAQEPDSVQSMREAMVAAVDDLEPVYGPELVGQAYKSSHARILEMERIPHERDVLLQQIENMTGLLRAERADALTEDIASTTQSLRLLSHKIADSVTNTDWLTGLVLFLSTISAILAADVLLKDLISMRKMLWIDSAIIAASLAYYFGVRFFKRYKPRTLLRGKSRKR